MEKARKIVIFGSSVAAGQYVSHPWRTLLAADLGEAFEVVDCSLSGSSTKVALQRVNQVAEENPDDVIVSLSLPNESMDVQAFKEGILNLQKSLQLQCPGVRVIMCGPYPCNFCSFDAKTFSDYVALVAWFKETFGDFIDFFSSIHNGKGGWPKNCYLDAVHPSDHGHKLMMQQIDVKKWWGDAAAL